MTYCVGIRPAAGLVMMADTRTNAGVDNISTYRKLHTLADSEDRLIVLASAGSLSVTQSMLGLLSEGLAPIEEDGCTRTLATVPTLFRAAQLVGEAVTLARKPIDVTLEGTGINASVSLLLGGRIGDAPLGLYLIYGEGNFIECSPDSPFLQIGERKYGKPMLDRALDWNTPLDEAVKIGLISFDAAMRSNLSVGRPLDLIAIPEDRARPVVRRRIEEDDAYYNTLSRRWGELLNEARNAIPDPPFMHEDD
jgi:putative proteasome-type protease